MDDKLIQLSVNVATLSEQVKNNCDRHEKQIKKISDIDEKIGVLITSIEVVTARLFKDNGKLSIISQFQKNDQELRCRLRYVEKKVDEITINNKCDKKTGINKKEWIKWGITSCIALFAFLLTLGVI